MELKKVTKFDYEFLYDMLKERDGICNISHTNIPTYENHVKFVESNPYDLWFIIWYDEVKVGNIYLTDKNEIGVFVLKKYYGKQIGKKSIKELMKLTKREYYLANINPSNNKSINLFNSLNFKHIQNTYKLVLN